MNKFINESKRTFTLDKTLMIILLALATISVSAIYMAGPLINSADAMDVVIRQIVWYVIGFTTVFLLLKFGTDRLFSLSYLAYWVLMFFLLMLVMARFKVIKTSLIPEINGSYAWFQIPKFGSFQPSEFMKIILVIISADIINKHNDQKQAYTFESDFQLIFKMARYVLPALVLIVLQPDTGIPIIILFSLATMFFLSGVRREWFLIIATISAFVFFGIIFLYYTNKNLLNSLMGGGYRINRFYGWLDYEKYPADEGYQLYQSLLSYGTAGLTGHDLRSIILFYPEAQTDFIFAVIAQNWGFIGATGVIILSILLDIKLVLITLRSTLYKEKYMMMGIVGMMMFQHLQNMGMIMGLLPITGITLPFISYGGSSLLSYMIPISVALFMSSETENEHRH